MASSYSSSALSDSSLASSSSGSSSSAAASYESTPSTAPTSIYKTPSSSRSTRHERPRRRSQEQPRRRDQRQEEQEQEPKRREPRNELDQDPPPTITFFPPSPAASLSSVATYDSLLSDAEPEPLSLSPDDDGNDAAHPVEATAAPSTVHLPSPADASIPAALPPYRTLIPLDPSLRPSDPYTFARLFPSLDRLAIRHDDTTADGNMNLRVETVVAPSSPGPSGAPGPVLGPRRRPATVQLFHLRMHDLARRDFSLRRYCRDSGREVCFSKRAYAPSSGGRAAAVSSASHTLQRALRSVKSPFRRSSSSSSSAGGGNGDASTTTSSPRNSLGFARRPSTGGSTVTAHTTASSSCWSRRGSTASSASLAGNALLSGAGGSGAAHPPPQVLVPTDTIKLEFSNYARVDVSRRHSSGSGGAATKAYEFEWWDHRYAWRRAVDRALGAVSFHLVRDGDAAAAVAHIVPEVRTPTQVFAEDRAGGWVPPCYMWISDQSVVDAVTDVADVIVATGLIALVDDSIRERWPVKKKPAHVSPYLLPTKPHFGPGPASAAAADADGEDAARRPGVRGFFSRRPSAQHSHSPLRLGRTVAVY
ncbi:hypothetical protein VFPFJ_01440 [Purpureocillium lilacinum]|uniref:Uncharacterized protein n=1 Tax=Purpureocillium lilacinum TaxID=33203 RepID=A0A179I123_PURLI|nr:hypothetical protein VFPFJ_01440 [Purpureocillium lilacinum]OAQ95330.1 hypothetical protein VFPFJ_01440 [Purpureocillium lilacinum]